MNDEFYLGCLAAGDAADGSGMILLESLEMSCRLDNACRNLGIKTLAELFDFKDFSHVPNIGRVTIEEINLLRQQYGYAPLKHTQVQSKTFAKLGYPGDVLIRG